MVTNNKNKVRQKVSRSASLQRIGSAWSFLFLLFCTLYFLLNVNVSFSQEKAGGIQKSKNITTIGGLKYYLHTVEKGQTLFAIAKCYDLSLNDIVIENPEAINGIKPGQILKVPFKKIKKIDAVPIPAGTNFILHTVEAGQTLYSISRQYNTTVGKIIELNPELKEGLKGGQTIKIPVLKQKAEPIKPANITKNINQVVEYPANTINSNDAIDTSFSMGPLDSLTSYLQDPKNRDTSKVKAPAFNYSGELKNEYNIAFFLPFHADEANQIDNEDIIRGNSQLPNKTTIALQFYEGALLAIDSLKKQKLKAKIFVYDIDDKDSLSIINILKKPEIAKMNLMIGPLYGSSFMPIAKFAKDHAIPIVSPFTQVNRILFNNPYVCKALPSSTLQVEQMAHFVVDTFHSQNIILVNSGNYKEITFYNAFKNTANRALIKMGYKFADSIKEIRSIAAVQSMLNPAKINVIVLPSNNQSYVTEFISKLNTLQDKNKIVLFGLQSWMNYDNLDFEYLNNLSVHLPSNNYIDYHDSITKIFIKNYRDKFKTDPETYAYQGFDVSYYFISSLLKYGSGFLKNITNNKYQGVETNFNFVQYPSNSGFENKFVYILKYQDNNLIKAN